MAAPGANKDHILRQCNDTGATRIHDRACGSDVRRRERSAPCSTWVAVRSAWSTPVSHTHRGCTHPLWEVACARCAANGRGLWQVVMHVTCGRPSTTSASLPAAWRCTTWYLRQAAFDGRSYLHRKMPTAPGPPPASSTHGSGSAPEAARPCSGLCRNSLQTDGSYDCRLDFHASLRQPSAREHVAGLLLVAPPTEAACWRRNDI